MRLTLLLTFTFLITATFSFSQIPNPRHKHYHWKTDTAKHTSNFAELVIAAEKDAIHPLNFPAFIHKTDSLYNYYDFEPAIVINFGSEARAYPLSVLTLFELSNDSITGKQIMVTYCPMCNAALVFNRNVKTPKGEQLLTFGISGLLMHNDMVMYDHQTESWWEQLMGEGVAGEYAGVELKMLPALLIDVKDFFDRFPDGKILSPIALNAYRKKHIHRPFHNLEDTDHLNAHYYIPEKTDPRLPPLEHILDIHLYGHDRVYPFHILAKQHVINETQGDDAIVIFYHGETVSVLHKDNLAKAKRTGSATAFSRKLNNLLYTFRKQGDYFLDDQTNSRWDITGYCREGKLQGAQLEILPHSNHFAFAYLAFYPHVEIYGISEEQAK